MKPVCQHMRIIAAITGLLLFIPQAKAQNVYEKQMRYPKYDYKLLHFGFETGFNYIDFNIRRIELLSNAGPLYTIEAESRPGFSLYLISDLRLHNYFNLRFTPGISYTQRDVLYGVSDPITGEVYETSKQVESTFLEFPIHLKYRSVRITNGRAYMLGGVKFMVDMASQENVDDPKILRIKKNDFGYELGFGVDFYFDYFKFSPQIKGTWGLNNVLVADQTVFTNGLTDLRTRAILISFCFE